MVQKGLRVRLQVFRTPDRGWAVRCRDDLDKGTFICIYAGTQSLTAGSRSMTDTKNIFITEHFHHEHTQIHTLF